eukprot:16430288-Heterocapsa_arctica.AAC.1
MSAGISFARTFAGEVVEEAAALLDAAGLSLAGGAFSFLGEAGFVCGFPPPRQRVWRASTVEVEVGVDEVVVAVVVVEVVVVGAPSPSCRWWSMMLSSMQVDSSGGRVVSDLSPTDVCGRVGPRLPAAAWDPAPRSRGSWG